MKPQIVKVGALLVLLIGLLICGSSAQTLEVEQATREVILIEKQELSCIEIYDIINHICFLLQVVDCGIHIILPG